MNSLLIRGRSRWGIIKTWMVIDEMIYSEKYLKKKATECENKIKTITDTIQTLVKMKEQLLHELKLINLEIEGFGTIGDDCKSWKSGDCGYFCNCCFSEICEHGNYLGSQRN